ncbi:MAG: protein-glutamate O-methyltransferase CheR [Deltaproteobacteria bacterium]|jgi:chemotaxis protein methyltransferase CheR|nr:protein-glutamate O-methyltransferase CheR [Deltaproteobacteria bacterium]
MSSLFASKGASPQKDLRVTDEEFTQLRDFIYQQSGIYIAENRKYLIENRLSNRIKELNLKSFGEYCYYLRFDLKRKDELVKLFASITTNETSFYRNPPQLQVFQDIILKKVLEDLRLKKSRKLRIWSAGCSTGEEPYTLTIMLHEVLKAEIAAWDIKINAMDLSEPVLASARRGVYSDYALRTTPKEIINKYFIFRNNLYEIRPEQKRLVNFMQGNLSDRLGLKRLERSHIVFCRNVIIYFDDNMKKQVVASFYDNLLPGGYLFIGHSESLHNISRGFKPESHPGAIVYLKES